MKTLAIKVDNVQINIEQMAATGVVAGLVWLHDTEKLHIHVEAKSYVHVCPIDR